ncbi:hypothetical protein [Streptomyces sp. NPDC058335]|uniref:hypothetical protein n=1 Tax=Streptomyces sp. NPDC058335 TaxID=3346451 RepID=UPI0036693EEA
MRADPPSAAATVDALAIISLPPLDGLAEEQLRGAACVWCGAGLTTDSAVDLGERRHKRLDGHYSTFPRGCPVDVTRAAVQALHDHAGSCEQCADAAEHCTVSLALYRIVRQEWR